VRRAAFEHEVAAGVDEDGAAVAGLMHGNGSLRQASWMFSTR
jgi:hypothetical protein